MKKILDFIVAFIEGFYLYFFGWLEPKWKKDARWMMKAAKRYINFRKDVLHPEKLAEIQQRLDNLRKAFREGNKEETITKTALVEQYAQTLPGVYRDALAENVEVLFVIFAIFLGLRAYVAQPFRIPTGSMQPSLNGIRAIDLEDKADPNLFVRGWDFITKGGSYFKAVADNAKTVRDYRDSSWFLFTRTDVIFDDGSKLTFPAPPGETQRYFAKKTGSGYPSFNKGDTIVNARVDAGDVVLVNKMAYNFRQPKRGEVFVFETKGIDGVHRRATNEQGAGEFYIKRLVGLPGDKLQVKTPALLVNGKEAEEPTIQRVIKGVPPFNREGYLYATPEGRSPIPLPQFINSPESVLSLAYNKKQPLLNEYAALGDNTTSSLDSRYWGPVRQFNVVGPGLFSLWPFTSHWGLIP